MRDFFGVLLILLAVLTGGCSLLATPFIFTYPAGVVFWILGLAIAWASAKGAMSQFRPDRREPGRKR